MIDLDDTGLVETHGRALALDAAVSEIVWIGGEPWFACGDGTVRIVGDDAVRAHRLHEGAVLAAAAHPDGRAIVTAGDDGFLLRTGPDGRADPLGDFAGRWVDRVVTSATSGLIVASVGKDAIVWKPGSTAPAHRYGFASTVGGLALDAKGKRLAVSGYGGATLLYANSADSGRVQMQWPGSHLACTIAPGGDYVVTAMQETGLHGWQLPSLMPMAMNGYRAKTRSFSWNRRGKRLASSGDPSLIIWPFDGKTGPMGCAPIMLGPREANVTCVAFHPRDEIIAAGYADGAVTMARLNDDAFVVLQTPGSDPVSALAWSGDGALLAWGGEDGRAGLIGLHWSAT